MDINDTIKELSHYELIVMIHVMKSTVDHTLTTEVFDQISHNQYMTAGKLLIDKGLVIRDPDAIFFFVFTKYGRQCAGRIYDLMWVLTSGK